MSLSNQKKYAIYCSGNASRVIRFFSNKQNCKYLPGLIIYDGNNGSVLEHLMSTFEDKLAWIDINSLTPLQQNKINDYTSGFIHNFMDITRCEYLICFGNKILKPRFVKEYHNRLINFHPSLLPAFKGLNAIDKALSKNTAILGNTAHYINENIDDGDIITQTSMLREDFSDYEDVLELQLPMLKLILRDILMYKVEEDEILNDIPDRKKPYLLPQKPLQIR